MNRIASMTAGAATVLLLAFQPVAAQQDTLALRAVNQAGEVIDAAIEAHGGQEALENLDSVVQKSAFKTWAVNQSRGAAPPWDQNEQVNVNAIDFSDESLFIRNTGEGGGFVFDNSTIIDGEAGYQVNWRAETIAPIAEPDFDTTSGPFIRVTAPLLIKQLMERRQTAHWLGAEGINGRPHDVVTLVMEVGPALSLYFDQQSHMLTRMERVLPPFGVVEYRFLDYQDVSGIPFAQQFELYINGDQNLDIEILETQVNADISEWVQAPSDLQSVAAITPDPLGLNTIADGVHLVGGNGTYALFVEQGDRVVAIGGTAGIDDRIEQLRQQVPDKPIAYGVLTHHHSDHVLGVPVYAGEGATVVTIAEHEEIVRQAAGDASVELEFVDGRRTIGEGAQRIELYDIGPTPHSEHVLIAWLPEHGILFEADHFANPVNGVIPPANPVTVALAEALERLEISPRMIVGAHSPRVATPADLDTALNKGRALAQN